MARSAPLTYCLKEIAKKTIGLRFRSRLSANLRMTRGDFDRYQAAAFRKMYAYATTRVPYYRDRSSVYRPEIGGVEPLGDALRSLPVLSKDELRVHNGEFFAVPPHRFTTTHTTSGTTGTPVRIRGDVWERALHEQAAQRQFYVVSGRWRPRTVRLTSAIPRNWEGGRRIHWDDPVSRVRYLSMYEVCPSRASEYRDLIEGFSPEVVFGYSSVLYPVADCIGTPLRLPRLRGVISTAETMRDDWQGTIERVFGCRVHEQYGAQESQFLVTECPSDSLHVNPEPGIVEVQDGEGRPAREGDCGAVLVTGLARLSMPLIRFDIGDYVVSTGFRSGCACGCAWPTVGTVMGRIDDLVATRSGKRLAAMNWHTTKDVRGIVKSQVVQHDLDRIEILVVAGPGYEREIAEKTMREVIRSFVGADVGLEFRYVDDIPTSGGKFRAVISHVRFR